MRIPPSVIVMSLLTAVPFGLAIRESVRHNDPVGDDDDDGLDLSGRAAATKARRVAMQEEQEAEGKAEADRVVKRAARDHHIATLFGDRPASRGGALDGVRIGAPAVRVGLGRELTAAIGDDTIRVTIDDNGAQILGVAIALDDGCDELGAKLETKWGPGRDGVWLDPATHQRASLTDCRIRFDRYRDAAEWVGAVPFELIGAPAKRLTETLGEAVEIDDDGTAHWRTDGLAGGHDPTVFEAFIRQGKIVGLKAHVDTEVDAIVATRAAVATRFHAQPVQEADSGVYVWNRRPRVTLEAVADTYNPGSFSLQIGTMPWE